MRRTLNPTYTGLIEPWKLKLARSRLKAMGFPRDQWPDLLQQLVVAMMNFRFVSEKSNGAKESTALFSLINNTLATHLRAQDRERNRMERHRERMGLAENNAHQHPLFVAEEQTEMTVDVRAAIDSLPQDERDMCQRLMRGESVGNVARDLRVGWHTVARVIERLRVRFTANGLSEWVHPE